MRRKTEGTLITWMNCKEEKLLVKISILAMKKLKRKDMNFKRCTKNKNRKKRKKNNLLHNKKLTKKKVNFQNNSKKFLYKKRNNPIKPQFKEQ